MHEENYEELGEQIFDLVNARRFGEVREILTDMEAADIALLLGDVPHEDLPLLYRILPKEIAAETFVEMDGDEQELLIEAFSDRELKEVIDDLYVDDAVDIIEEMPANVVRRILKHTDPETRKSINDILRYPKDSAGSIMTVEYVNLRRDMTVEESFIRIRRTGVDKETIYTCYVTDTNRKLLGLVTVKDLLLAEYSEVIEDIMETNVISVNTLEDKEHVAHAFDKYDFMAIPVVDAEERLVGIVTFDDAIDVIQDENTEDMAKMAAVVPSEESYLKTSVWKHAKNRIFWLLFLMLSAAVTGSIITSYEDAFVQIPLLVAFIPMLMGTGGNCGSQSSTMIIRGMALDEISIKDFFRVLFKETRVALLVGVMLAIANAARVFIMYPNDDPAFLAVTSGLSMICTVFIAKSLGCVLPMLAKKCKLDPALMAAPLITTILDTCSVLIFFNIALWIMTWGI
ncbi:MAG: magnesium transporter [Oscillospiraceae bacterium]